MSFQPIAKPSRDPLNRAYYLPRLPRGHYQGDAVVLWTLTIQNRATGWLTPDLHGLFRELMLHAAAREGLVSPIYCLMPDHLHLVWMGLRADSDQLNGMAFLRTHLEPALAPARFQNQAQDRVLRQEQREREAFARVCFYVVANPLRAGLVTRPEEWRLTGSVAPGYPRFDLRMPTDWPRFWKIYGKLRQPEASQIVRPPARGVGCRGREA